jgi:hypothetical protein
MSQLASIQIEGRLFQFELVSGDRESSPCRLRRKITINYRRSATP